MLFRSYEYICIDDYHLTRSHRVADFQKYKKNELMCVGEQICLEHIDLIFNRSLNIDKK